MSSETDTWLVLLTAGMSLFVAGLLFMRAAPWYVEYGIYALALAVSLFAVRLADLETASA
jgi:hypothetical protein